MARTSHARPWKPRSQKQRPCRHFPRPPQALGQPTGSPHPGPRNPGSHQHAPFLQSPCPEQLLRHRSTEQSEPANCGKQRHAPATQMPFREHSLRQLVATMAADGEPWPPACDHLTIGSRTRLQSPARWHKPAASAKDRLPLSPARKLSHSATTWEPCALTSARHCAGMVTVARAPVRRNCGFSPSSSNNAGCRSCSARVTDTLDVSRKSLIMDLMDHPGAARGGARGSHVPMAGTSRFKYPGSSREFKKG